ncbi:MAG: helix-turn-helix domain-containing protein [Streptosporangiaceae bacterium]
MADLTPAQRLGQRVHAARTEQGLTLQQVGTAAGISHTAVMRLEHGCEVEFSNAARIAGALGISLDEPDGETS